MTEGATGTVGRVAMLVRDPGSSSSRVRLLQYRPAFEAAGVDTGVLGWEVRSRRDVARYALRARHLARWADVVVVQKPAQPPWVLRMLARSSRLVVDLDDAVWVSGGQRGRVTEASTRLARRLRLALELGRGAVAGSAWLAERLREQAPGVAVDVVRPSVDLEAYEGLGGHDEAASVVQDRRPTIGWIGSAANAGDFTRDALDGIRPLITGGRARLVVVSSEPPDLDGIPAELVEWSEDREVAAVASFDIGLMPLHDDERSRGRCGYKAIQCLAAGVPVVASPVGSAVEIVSPGETGLLAHDAREWECSLSYLVDNSVERQQMGARGREWVRTNAALTASFPRLLDVLCRAVRR